MRKGKIVTGIYGFILAASLISADILPAFASEVLEEPTADETQIMEENFADEAATYTEDTESEVIYIPATEEEPGTESGSQKKDDGLIYVNDTLYNGYYMDSDGIFCIVTNGITKPFNGIANEGTGYYNCDNAGVMILMTLSGQTVFVEGKAYRGYYADDNGKMYKATDGTLEPKTGIVKKGTKYYNYNTKKTKTLSKRTLYVKGDIYSGYYMNSTNKMYRVKKGALTLKTGTAKKGTKYYNYNTKRTKTLSKQTLYVKGKVYNGYYMDNKNKMYSVKKGTRTLKTGVVKKGTKYYSYKSKKTEKLSKEDLYVDGEVYNGYYLGSDNMMYVKANETYTQVNTILDAGTAYYSCNENKMLALSVQAAYIYGKAIEGMSLEQMATLYKAQAVVQTVSEPTDSKSEQLYKCYLWMEKFPYKRYRTMSAAIISYPETWDVVFANDIFETYSGCCASEACAFAYLAKACGYENVTICSDTAHAWVDIDGRLYDPLFAEAKSFRKNYDADYTDYRIHPAYTKKL